MPRKRYGKPGDLTQLRRVLWQAILDTKTLTDTEQPSPELVLKSAHALAQLAGAYRAVTETAELEARIEALEMAAERHGTP